MDPFIIIKCSSSPGAIFILKSLVDVGECPLQLAQSCWWLRVSPPILHVPLIVPQVPGRQRTLGHVGPHAARWHADPLTASIRLERIFPMCSVGHLLPRASCELDFQKQTSR